MLPQTIIDRARRLSSTSSKYYSDADGFADLNQVKNDLWSTIVTYVDENYWWQEFDTDTVVGQTEYTLPPITATVQGTKKIKDVKVAYSSSVYPGTLVLQYVEVLEVDPSSLPFPWSYYVEFQDPLRPIYKIADNSIFIAPAATVAVDAGLVITGIRNIPDYDEMTTEDDMVIPLDQQENMVFGLIPYIFDQKTMAAESQAAQKRYEERKSAMTSNLSDRVIAPFVNQFPDDMAKQINASNNFNITS